MTEPARSALAVAVVSFNTRALLERCLTSVEAARPAETVVVDNGSTDGSLELVRAAFPTVRLLVNDRNRGYGAAANRAIASCAAPAVLLLNSDTLLEPCALHALEGYLDAHPAAAIVGPRLETPDRELQPSTFPFPSLADLLVADTGLHLLLRRAPLLRERWLRTWGHDRSRPVPWVNGAALLVRRAPYDVVGGFDEEFFMYWEEVDLARRLARAGFETHFAPVTTVVHVRGASTSQQPAAMRREWHVNRRRYLARHEPPRRARTLLGLQRALDHARVARDGARALASRDATRRAGLRASIAARRALLAERTLWRP